MLKRTIPTSYVHIKLSNMPKVPLILSGIQHLFPHLCSPAIHLITQIFDFLSTFRSSERPNITDFPLPIGAREGRRQISFTHLSTQRARRQPIVRPAMDRQPEQHHTAEIVSTTLDPLLIDSTGSITADVQR
jgi:hypothetical protein